MTKKQLIEQNFKDILDNPVFDEQIIGRYFDRDYVQYVDGKKLDYEMFCQHMKALKNKTKSLEVKIISCVEQGDEAFTNHLVSVVDANGNVSTIKVIAYFKFRNEKVILCDELTFHLEGDIASKDLGSVIE
ncbi:MULTISPECIES: nuclear transport factor 2 family protein [Myroides]|uniref:Nuclear transport factor 2 family protein n=1 Tax=Myroides albus TaxID=2562892 RepID=A0A6I3LQ01_9FLAO|nr:MULTISPECIES: nuclear transport factor 2 family protein [Myroides]MTG99420.1 hypothetical protein [Myroides albus]MVX35931.1 hypothetical protein [Myroides sp. LoEW2-1]UVD80420.1 nuclear transport factor 2 family protein [Myroides albus]